MVTSSPRSSERTLFRSLRGEVPTFLSPTGCVGLKVLIPGPRVDNMDSWTLPYTYRVRIP